MTKVFDIAFKLGGELSNSFKSTFKQAGGAMTALTAAATAVGGVVGFGQLAAQIGEMDNQLKKLSAQTGTFGAEMEELGGIAENLFRNNYGESFEDITSALANVKQNMKTLDGSELEKMTANALTFASTFDSDVNEVTRAANNMMNSFGIESEKAMDLFVAGTQRGLNFSDELLDNVAEYAPLFSQMGYSAEEYFGILERGGNNAYNLDYLNDVMKEFQIRIKDGSKATSDAMALMSKDTNAVWDSFLKGNGTVSDVVSTVISELKNMDDQILAGQIAVSLFGTKFEDLEATTVYAMLGTTEAMTGFEGAMESINKVRFDTFGKAIQGIGRILFMDLVYPIGKAALPYLNTFANFLSKSLPNAIKQTKAILSTIAPIVLGMVSAFLVYKGTLAAIALKQSIFNAIQGASIALYNAHRAAMIAYSLYGRGLTGIIHGMAAAMKALNISMLANPFVAVVAAIVGVGVAFYAAYKMSDRFREAVNNSYEAVRNFASDAGTYASRIWNDLVKGAQELPERLKDALGSIGMGNPFGGLIDSFKAGFSSLPGILSMVAPMLTTMALSFVGVTGPIGLVIGGVVSLVGFLYRLSQTNEGVASAISNAWQSIQTAFAPVMQVLSEGMAQFTSEVGPELAKTFDVISTSITALAPSFAELGSTLVELGLVLFTTWSEVGTTLVTAVLPLLLQVFSTTIPIIVGLISAVIPIVLQLAQMVIPLILSVVQMVFPLVLSIIQTVLPIVAQLLTSVIGIVLQLAQTVIPILLSVVQMVFPMILTVIQTVIPIIAEILKVVVTVLNSVVIPAINGLLKVIQVVFPYIQLIIQNTLAIINGVLQAAMSLLKGNWDGAWNAIKGTAVTIMNNIVSFFRGINLFDVGKSIISGLINGIKSMGSAVLGAIKGMIPEPIRGVASKLLGNLPGFADGGIINSPTLAWVGEGGDTETVIPWNNSQRSKELWMATGDALGMLNTSESQSDPFSIDDLGFNNNASDSKALTLQASFNTTFNINGDANIKDEIKRAVEDAKEEFDNQMKDWLYEQTRRAFG